MAVVTISRQMGAQGIEIGQRAAELLSYELVDKEIISEVARAAKVPEEVVAKYDEVAEGPVKTFVRDLLTPADTSAGGTRPLSSYAWAIDLPYELPAFSSPFEEAETSEEVHFLDQQECLRFVQQVVQHLWRRSRVVIVGRGSQIILAGVEDVLHVRVVASEESRCERLMQETPEFHSDYRGATNLIRQSDRRRARYLKRFYHVDWDDPSLYHILLNAEKTGVELAAEVIAAGVRLLEDQPRK